LSIQQLQNRALPATNLNIYYTWKTQEFNSCTETQCICGKWGHEAINCQQLAMCYLIMQYIFSDETCANANIIVERCKSANSNHAKMTRSTIDVLEQISQGATKEEILSYMEDANEENSDFL
jgi:hypothetical protein